MMRGCAVVKRRSIVCNWLLLEENDTYALFWLTVVHDSHGDARELAITHQPDSRCLYFARFPFEARGCRSPEQLPAKPHLPGFGELAADGSS